MNRPAWMPTGNEVVKQLLIAAVIGGAIWWWHRRTKTPDAGTS